ncbi:MAG: hypothetical protein JNG88_13285 [Phycisphaerales bacterium]|nr:hypothetical protein [Phycisphaerales bacterium]
MRAALGLLALVIGGIFAYFHFFGFGAFDLTKQGEEAKAAIKPGMPWTTVMDVCKGPPQEYQIITPDPKTKMLRAGPSISFDEKQLASDIQNKAVPDGFVFIYKFTEQIAFAVIFSENGNVVNMHDVRTMADLLQTRNP